MALALPSSTGQRAVVRWLAAKTSRLVGVNVWMVMEPRPGQEPELVSRPDFDLKERDMIERPHTITEEHRLANPWSSTPLAESYTRRGGARVRELGPSTALTAAERRVAELICAGHSRSSVAETLYVSINTVGTHLRSIYSKLHVNSQLQMLLALQDSDGVGQTSDVA
jgi:DNA-binding CsgD family transcriptional regulator